MLLVPCLVMTAFSILTMLIVWKGSPKLKLGNLSTGTIVGAIFGTGGVATALYIIFCYPYYKRKLVHEDWTLKWYHIFMGPVYWFKSTDDIPPMPEGHQLTQDFYKGRRYDEAGNLIELGPNGTTTSTGGQVESLATIDDSNSDGEKLLLLFKTMLFNLILKNNNQLQMVQFHTNLKPVNGQTNTQNIEIA